MANIIDFVVIFEDDVRKRHYHEIEHGKIIYFSVQLEIRVKDKWKVVIRYDCSHGFAHIDKYDVECTQTKQILDLSFENALILGDWDINKNWKEYKAEFLGGIKNGKLY